MASLFNLQEGNMQIRAEEKDPTWFQNSARRVIPNHLVPRKRLAFQLSATNNNNNNNSNKKDTRPDSSEDRSSNSNLFSSTDFNMISFGNTAHRNSSASHADSLSLFLTADGHDVSETFDNDDIPMYNDNEDLPPARSLYDLNDEVIISLNKPQQHTGSFINKDPKEFLNAFHEKNKISNTTDEDLKNKLHPISNSESAVLVFGYPEAMTSQIIAYFSDFGNILENFEALKNSKKANANILLSFLSTNTFHSQNERDNGAKTTSSAPPLFSGSSWVKLTFDNPTSATDALQESGSVFNGVLIGVIPYTKDAIEKLQKRKLTLLEDIGGGFQLFLYKETAEVDKGNIGDSNDMQASYIKRLDVKDGTDLFLKTNKSGLGGEGPAEGKNERLGLVASVTRYFFGFHDL